MRRGTRITLALLALILLAAFLFYKFETYREPEPSQPVAVTADAPAPSAAPATEEPAPVQSEEPETPPEPTVDPETPYGKALANAAAQGLPTPPEVDITSWEFTLVNGDHSIGEYVPEQLAYLQQTLTDTEIHDEQNGSRCPVDARIAEALLAFGQGCKDAGLPVYLSSGYRSYSDQAANFQRICRNNGVSDGKLNGHYITMPAGCSEHQLAMCCDITDKYYPVKSDDIVAGTATARWLLEHCAEYGFVQRFPDGKQAVTGVMNEAWHFRYVGPEAARYMTDNNLVLEEFLALYGVE
jgi:D-alanyl-D-alanine carboxypeptidase